MKLSALMLVAALALPAFADKPDNPDKPKPYTSAALGFTATFPSPPKENVLSDGSGNAAAIDPKGLMYMVGSMPIGPEAAGKTVKQLLDDGIDGALEQVHGTLQSQKDIKLGSDPGREFEVALKGGHATFRAYIVRPKVYLIGVVHKDGVEPPMKPADFFKSLQIKK
jgi:hypothetical protein